MNCKSFFGIAFAILSFLLLAITVQADSLSIQLTSSPPDEVNPGSIVTFAALVFNDSSETSVFEEEVELPTGWRLLFETGSFEVEGGSSSLRLISLVVPSRGLAGEYNLVYRVSSEEGISSEIAIVVRVSAILDLRISRIEGPAYVLAGDSYEITFSVQNSSNVSIVLDLEARDNLSYRLSLSKETLSLNPGETETVKITVRTLGNIADQRTHAITLTATEKDSKIGSTSSRSTAVIIPSADALSNRYHVLSSRLTVATGFSDGYFLQTSLSIEGFIDDSRTRTLSLALSVPIIGASDDKELSITARYRGSILEFGYGTLSSIGLASASVGVSTRGFDLQFRQGWLHFGGVISEDAARYGLFLDLRDTGGLSAGIAIDGPLGKVGDSTLSAAVQSRKDLTNIKGVLRIPLNEGKLDGVELSYNSTTRLDRFQIGSFLEYSKELSEPLDREQLKAGGNLRWIVPGSWSASLDVSLQRNNPFDFLEGGLLNRYSVRGRLRLPPLAGFTFSLAGNYSSTGSRHDSSPGVSTGAEISLSYSYRNLSTYTSLGIQYTTSGGKLDETRLFAIQLSYRFSPSNYASSRFSLREHVGNRYDSSIGLLFTHNVSANSRLRGSISYSMRDLSPSRLTGEISFASVFMGGSTLSGNASLDVKDFDSWKPQVSFSVSYTYPFFLPVWPRTDLSSLNGLVYLVDGDEKRPIANAVIKLNNLVAITNTSGEFVFAGLTPGDYYIDIDSTSLERGLITREPLPKIISVEPGEEEIVQIELEKAASLRIDVVSSDESDPRLGGIRFVIRGSGETYRLQTSVTGSISLPNLKPGEWSLTLESASLPDGYIADTVSRYIKLSPGESSSLTFKISRRLEEIKIIDTGEL